MQPTQDVIETRSGKAKSWKQDVEICETDGYPIVYGENNDKDLPTVLVYGHYDVQPADPMELWTSPHLSL
jgi:acetylornithine deacetylase/succinyl-diaminopimelate desuccinylase-like protein